ncbi:MAG: hypothetical protein HY901_03240, partial [Deltaproteobacteria bacterium]|nr:hypothetical protein [Deltaproteobacteria bacterium]
NELCSDNVDNDNNGHSDCDDFSCCRYGQPASGITVCTSGTCGGGARDGGTSSGRDAGTKPVLTEVEATIVQIRTQTSDYSDVTSFPAVPKKIVTIKDVIVVGSYKHSAGDVDLYIQEAAGGAHSGINVNYTPAAGGTPAAVGKKVTVKGCVKTSYGVMLIQWCGDADNTQATVTETGTGTVPTPDAFPASELGAEATTHDDHIGQPIRVQDELTVDSATADECKGSNGSFFCLKLKDASNHTVYLKTDFVHKCSAAQLAGPFTDLVGAWDFYQTSSKALLRQVAPLSCDAL